MIVEATEYYLCPTNLWELEFIFTARANHDKLTIARETYSNKFFSKELVRLK